MRLIIRDLIAVSVVALPLHAWSQGGSLADTTDELMSSLNAFTCAEQQSPFLISRTSEGWGISGFEGVDSVEVISRGYRLESTENENFLGFLRQERESWSLMLFDITGSSQSRCVSIDEVVSWVISEVPDAAIATLREQLAVTLAELASSRLAEQLAITESKREVALLNEQVIELRSELVRLQSRDSEVEVARLQALLNLAGERVEEAEVQVEEAQVQIESLSAQLNTATLRRLAEERRRAQLEEELRLQAEAEAARLAAEAQNLERYRSEFFGELREIIGQAEGIQIVGDRFVFSSEVLFEPGAAQLSPEGQDEISKIGATLRRIAREIPREIDWIIRVDGHTDNVPLSGLGEYADNWELSQARALSFVRFMIANEGIEPMRFVASGFGEYWPINTDDSDEGRAQNRRIELRLTTR